MNVNSKLVTLRLMIFTLVGLFTVGCLGADQFDVGMVSLDQGRIQSYLDAEGEKASREAWERINSRDKIDALRDSLHKEFMFEAGKDSLMKAKHSPEQIVAKLRQADVELGKGLKVPEVCKQLGISEQTYYRWRTKYGGMVPEMARQMKALERENSQLKKLVADLSLDNQILKEAARPNL